MGKKLNKNRVFSHQWVLFFLIALTATFLNLTFLFWNQPLINEAFAGTVKKEQKGTQGTQGNQETQENSDQKTQKIFTSLKNKKAAYRTSNTNQSRPEQLKNVGVTNPIGNRVNPALTFKNSKGEEKTLGHYFKSGQPLLLAMIYYECPSLCNYHVKALLSGLFNLKLTVGRDFKVILVSMDEREGSDLAFKKREAILKSYERKEGIKGWHLLTGSRENIRKLSENLNFKFKWVEEQEIFSHASVTYVLTPEGKVSHTLSGLDSLTQNIRLSLLKASEGKMGSFLDKILLYCYRFDPKAGRYTLYAYNVMKLGGGFTVILLFGFLAFSFSRQRRMKIQNKSVGSVGSAGSGGSGGA